MRDTDGKIMANEFDTNTLLYDFVSGKKITSKLLYIPEDKHLYKIKRYGKEQNTYICRKNGCNSRVYLKLNGNCAYPNPKISHDHTTQEEEYQNLKILENIKNVCKSGNPLENGSRQLPSVREIYDATMIK